MKQEIEASGKTVEAAILNGARELGVDRSLITYEILEMPKKGFLGFGEVLARVRVSYEAGAESTALEFVNRLIADMDLGATASVSDVYLILQQKGVLQSLTVNQVCTGIFSITALAFIAGGMNFIYQIERLPLMVAILIHGSVLYVSYLGTYLINSWLERGIIHLLVFTGIFVVGYLMIWAVIYSVIKKRTASINEMLRKKQSQM